MGRNNRLWKHLLALSLVINCAGSGRAQVTYERLLKAGQEPHNWLTYSGDYAALRHSRLNQVDVASVAKLEEQWVFRPEPRGKLETTPLVIDGLLYGTGVSNTAWALDARTGKLLWSYKRQLPQKVVLCCGQVNRGFAALGQLLFLATLDAHVIALDAKTGKVVWDVEAADHRKGYSFTLAPLVVKDKVIVGVSGGEFGIRGFIDAYSATTGKLAWRYYTIPAPGEPGSESWHGDSWKSGGSPAWVTGAYDPALNLIYWGTGNPSPSYNAGPRRGDNLYSNSVVALDADTGKMKWYFQFTPQDQHDWDATQIPVLLDMEFRGRRRKLLALANRNAFFYVLDRTDGKFLLARQFARQTWAKEIAADGRPVRLPGTEPRPEGTYVCPGAEGGANWMSPAYNPDTGLLYVPVREHCDKFHAWPQPYREGHWYTGGSFAPPDGEKDWGALRALDPKTGEMRWEYRYNKAAWGGALSTAGGLVFAGDFEGHFRAFDARTGKALWLSKTESEVHAAPITYAVEGRQYVVIASGGNLHAYALPVSAVKN